MNQARNRLQRSGLSWVIAALALQGCAPMSPGRPVVTDTVVRKERANEATGKARAEFKLEETTLTVRAEKLCDVREVNIVERRTVTRLHNDAPQNDWWAGIIGVGCVVGGGYIAAYPERAAPEKTATDGPDSTRRAGWTLVALGALLLSVPVIDAVRSGSIADESTTTLKETGATSEKGTVCGKLGNAIVKGTVAVGAEDAQVLGTTSDAGVLQVDLDEELPQDQLLNAASFLSIVVGDDVVGRVSLKTVYSKRENRAWKAVAAATCRVPTTAVSCAPVEAFLKGYPDGPHAAEAREVLAAAQSELSKLQDEDAWRKADVAGCTTAPDPTAIETACATLEIYLSGFPSGMHAKEAETTKNAGLARAEKLRLAAKATEDAKKAALAKKEAAAAAAAAGKQACVAKCQQGCGANQPCVGACIKAKCP